MKEGYPYPVHGNYLPADVTWRGLNQDHHVAYLHVLRPGFIRRKSIRIGELRHSPQPGKRGERCWRAFPERVDEFPELCDTHFLALQYLKDRWLAGPVALDSPSRPKRKPYRGKAFPPSSPPPPPPTPSWPSFFGEDPFADL